MFHITYLISYCKNNDSQSMCLKTIKDLNFKDSRRKRLYFEIQLNKFMWDYYEFKCSRLCFYHDNQCNTFNLCFILHKSYHIVKIKIARQRAKNNSIKKLNFNNSRWKKLYFELQWNRGIGVYYWFTCSTLFFILNRISKSTIQFISKYSRVHFCEICCMN